MYPMDHSGLSEDIFKQIMEIAKTVFPHMPETPGLDVTRYPRNYITVMAPGIPFHKVDLASYSLSDGKTVKMAYSEKIDVLAVDISNLVDKDAQYWRDHPWIAPAETYEDFWE